MKRTLLALLTAALFLSTAALAQHEPEVDFTVESANELVQTETADASLQAVILMSGTCGENLTWSLDSEGVLLISGTGDMTDYSSYTACPWYNVGTQVKKIVVEEGVTSIDEMAFSSCTKVEELIIPFIGNCRYVSDGENYSLAYIFTNDKFDNRIPQTLKKVTITNETIIWGLHYIGMGTNGNQYGGTVEEIVITGIVKEVRNLAFGPKDSYYENDCVKTLYMPYVPATYDRSFEGLTKLSDLYFTGSRNQFYSMNGISVFKNTTIHYNDKGTNGNLSNWELTFDNDLVISGEGEIITNDYYTYADLVDSIIIESDVATLSNSDFYEMYANTAFSVSADNNEYCSVDGVIFTKDMKTLIAYPAGKTDTSYQIPEGVTTIAENAFTNTNLVSITVPTSVISVESNAFSDRDTLASVYFNGTTEEWNNISVADGNDAFIGADITIGKYAVSYNTNGGSETFDSQIKTVGEDVVIISDIPTKEGHSFLGWSVSLNGEVAYKSGDTYSEDANLTLYAVWKADVYTITYDANGGENAPISQSKEYNETVTLSIAVPTRSGYDFAGWATTPGGNVRYTAGAKYSANSNVTFYAVWTLGEYSIVYDSNGGTSAPASQSKTHGTDITITSSKPSRAGYIFLGWSTDAYGDVEYAPGAAYTDNASIILYAVWEVNAASPTITVSSETARPDSTVTVAVDISNNPGIAGMVLSLSHDENLTLVSIENGDALDLLTFTKPGSLTNPCKILWDGTEGDTDNGTIMLLTFKIGADVTAGEYGISLSYSDGTIFDGNLDNVSPVIINGTVSVHEYNPGDVDDDGEIGVKDILLIRRHIVGGYDIEMLEEAADVDGDGEITAKDIIILRRYIVGGYDVELQ